MMRLLIGTGIALVASGLMIASAYMPWLGTESGLTFSGMDLYDQDGRMLVPWMFTDESGGPVPFLTGPAMILSGLWFAVCKLGVLAVAALLRRMTSRGWTSVLLVLATAAPVLGFMAPALNAMFFFEGGPASGASLEYGLILLWAAAVAEFIWLMTFASFTNQRQKGIKTRMAAAHHATVG